MDRLRWTAIWQPALSVALFLLPVAIVMEAVRPSGAVLGLCFVGILFLAATAGFGAAKLAPERPLPNGAAAAALSYAIVQSIGIVSHLVSGEGSAFLTYVYLALLMATCGMLGAMLERRTRVMR